jgi:hypothetical protein
MKRRRGRRWEGYDPFAWFLAEFLLAAALSLSANALAVLLGLNANWDHRIIRSVHGRTSLSDRQGKAMLGLGKAALDAGRRELIAAGLIVEREAATKPGGPGGALGLTAIYDLPHRHRGPQQRALLPADVKRPEGHLQYNVHRLRQDLRAIRGEALRVFIYALTKHDRTRHAELASAEPFELSVAEISRHLGLKPSTAAAAIICVIQAGLLAVVREASGRAPRLVRLPEHHWKPERKFRPTPAQALVATIDPGSGGYEPQRGETDLGSGGKSRRACDT